MYLFFDEFRGIELLGNRKNSFFCYPGFFSGPGICQKSCFIVFNRVLTRHKSALIRHICLKVRPYFDEKISKRTRNNINYEKKTSIPKALLRTVFSLTGN